MTRTGSPKCSTCGGADAAPNMIDVMRNEHGEPIDDDSQPELCDEPCHD